MSRNLRQTDKTIEKLRANRHPISQFCSFSEIIKKGEDGDPDELSVTYCKNVAEIRGQMRCNCYAYPSAMWRGGKTCLRATHIRETSDNQASGKIRVGQQKQKKKSRR